MKRQVILWVFVLVASLIFAISTDMLSKANANTVKLAISSIDTPKSHVATGGGERGAAIAGLSDGRYFLGGGKAGFTLYLFDQSAELNAPWVELPKPTSALTIHVLRLPILAFYLKKVTAQMFSSNIHNMTEAANVYLLPYLSIK